MAAQKFEVSLVGGDVVSVELHLQGDVVQSSHWSVVGSLRLLEAAQVLKKEFKGPVPKLPLPQGMSPEHLLLKKLVLKIKGEWLDEESDPELCHCRKIPQAHVERAIILGAHTVEKVRARTSANTGCGTCLPDVEVLLEKFLK